MMIHDLSLVIFDKFIYSIFVKIQRTSKLVSIPMKEFYGRSGRPIL